MSFIRLTRPGVISYVLDMESKCHIMHSVRAAEGDEKEEVILVKIDDITTVLPSSHGAGIRLRDGSELIVKETLEEVSRMLEVKHVGFAGG